MAMADVIKHVVTDPGKGRRLGADVRKSLIAAVRSAGAEHAGALLLVIEGAAFDHAPEIEQIPGGELAPDYVHRDFFGLARTFLKAETPIVVYLDGPVTGFGLGLIASADVRVASDAATFSLGEPRAAALLLSGGTWLVPGVMGSGTLASMAWTGARLSASQALSAGFVSSLQDGVDGAFGVAAGVAGLTHSARSTMKRALNSRRLSNLTEQLMYESWLLGVALSRPSEKDGPASS